MIKNGRRVVKVVKFGLYGNPERPNRQLQFHRYEKRPQDLEPDETVTRQEAAWSCENDEVDKLLAFLHSDVARSGRYQVVDKESPAAALLELLGTNEIDTQSLVNALAAHTDVERIIKLLATLNERALSAAQSAVLERRRKLVIHLRRLIDDPSTTETDVQNLIGREHWIFGGQYVGVAERRNLTMLDQHDVPLLSSDGTLHVVELKGPNVKDLIVRHRNHWIVGPAVHVAAAQAANYLRDLDEQGLLMSKVFANELGQQYDMSRCFATVVVGHSDHRRPRNAQRADIARTLRQYSASLNRVEVISYDQLVDRAARALDFETEVNTSRPDPQSQAIDSGYRVDPCDFPSSSPPWNDDEPPF